MSAGQPLSKGRVVSDMVIVMKGMHHSFVR